MPRLGPARLRLGQWMSSGAPLWAVSSAARGSERFLHAGKRLLARQRCGKLLRRARSSSIGARRQSAAGHERLQQSRENTISPANPLARDEAALSWPEREQVGRTIKMTLDARLRDEMHAALPSLRAFAMSLCSNPDYADDLVQETLLRGLSKIHLFERGTNLEAWLFKILRNQFYSAYRKRRREVEDPEQTYAQKVGCSTRA